MRGHKMTVYFTPFVLGITILILGGVIGGQYWTTKWGVQELVKSNRTLEEWRLSQTLDGVYLNWTAQAEQTAELIAAIPEVAQGAASSESKLVVAGLDQVAAVLQVAEGVADVRVYDRQRRLMAEVAGDKAVTERPLEPISSVGDALPIRFVDCPPGNPGKCTHYVVVPLPYKGKTVGHVAIGYPISELLRAFHTTANVQISFEYLNPYVVDEGMAWLWPATITPPGGMGFVARFDSAAQDALVRKFSRQTYLLWLGGIVFLGAVLLYVIRRFLVRLRNISERLPTLILGDVKDLRDGVAKQKWGRYKEVHHFAESVLLLADRVEEAQVQRERALKAQAERETAAREAAERAEFIRRTSHAAEDERRRLAQELHDELGQRLVAMRFDAIGINKLCPETLADVRSRVDMLANNIQSAGVELKRLIGDIRPELLDTLGLTASIRAIVQEWRSRLPACALELNIAGALDSLNDPVQVAVYRIVQESITNVAKYAEATKVDFDIRCDGGLLSLSVRDNGVGFDPETTPRGRGLRGMRDRAVALGGEFELIASPGNGVKLFVRIPVLRESGHMPARPS